MFSLFYFFFLLEVPINKSSIMMTIAKDGIVIQRGPSATIAIKPAAPNKVKRNVCQKVIEYL